MLEKKLEIYDKFFNIIIFAIELHNTYKNKILEKHLQPELK